MRYLSQTDANPPSLGSSNTVYVSLPDSSSKCGSWGLPILPLGYIYHCSRPNTYRNVNGNGWIPVNLSSLSLGSPLGTLPIDPTNTSSSRLYYTYATDGNQYEVTAPMESAKYGVGGTNDVISGDGGTLATVYEKGSRFGLEPLDYGDPSLVGLWTFDEGTSTVAYDYSGNNATGSWNGSGAHWSMSKVGSGAGQFATTTNDYIQTQSLPGTPSAITVLAWVRPNKATDDIVYGNAANFDLAIYPGGKIEASGAGSTVNRSRSTDTIPVDGSAWSMIGMEYSNGGTIRLFKNGAEVSAYDLQFTGGSLSSFTNVLIGGPVAIEGQTSGLIDDVRIYNRALSAAQIAAMYAGGK